MFQKNSSQDARGLPVSNIENYVRKRTANIMSVTHDYSHLHRTALYARWFVKTREGHAHDQDLAYIAGLLHDIVRPLSEKICHAKASSDETKRILKRFNVPEGDAGRIYWSVRDHRQKPKRWKDTVHLSVYFADKIMEQMGGFVPFRRSAYCAECIDYVGQDPIKSTIYQFTMRTEKFKPTAFPAFTRRLARAQYKWSLDFLNALKRREEWATHLALSMYGVHKSGIRLEEAIRAYKPRYREDRIYWKEALRYINGKSFKEYEKLLSG